MAIFILMADLLSKSKKIKHRDVSQPNEMPETLKLKCQKQDEKKMKLVEFAISVGPDETAHHELPCHDLHCMH